MLRLTCLCIQLFVLQRRSNLVFRVQNEAMMILIVRSHFQNVCLDFQNKSSFDDILSRKQAPICNDMRSCLFFKCMR